MKAEERLEALKRLEARDHDTEYAYACDCAIVAEAALASYRLAQTPVSETGLVELGAERQSNLFIFRGPEGGRLYELHLIDGKVHSAAANAEFIPFGLLPQTMLEVHQDIERLSR
ncbi:hypothetical protein [Planctomyces sp. SH-PL14]|uniref:hypothetical protein n=1 Tax=Planctomyces sp. SH-PL14 TaxID=1632864 RepID=UPI00078EC363|nr:hypothetical protein [Planctomyces sp. SH-PL14]AMV20440.1 hypothetical protein VT03_21255 [Planctomyces sp. SH-PL14]